MDFDPRDYDSRDDERHGSAPNRGNRNVSDDRDRDDDWRQPDVRPHDRDARVPGRSAAVQEAIDKPLMSMAEIVAMMHVGVSATATVVSAIGIHATRSRGMSACRSPGTARSNHGQGPPEGGESGARRSPVTVLVKPAEVRRFKAAYRKGREVATVNRALSTLRAAINSGRFQDPPYLATTPFHRFGVTIRTKEETKRDRRIGLHEKQALLAASGQMGGAEHKYVGSAMHDRVIGGLETCCRRGEMLRIQNRHVDWERHQIVIPGRHAKDAENRRIPFDPQGRLAPVLKRRASLGPNAYVFGSPAGEFVANFKTAWESLLLIANGHETKRAKPGARVDRAKLRQVDLHWHDLRHEGACRLLADGVDIRTIQLMLGHADIKQTQRYLNITDEELRKAMTGVWERRRQLRAVSQ
jgi:integrase